MDPTGEVPLAPIVWSYFRCIASCTARSSVMELITDDIDCWPNALTDNAKDCAISCANPLNWVGKDFWAKNRSTKKYSNRGSNHRRNRTGSNKPKHERAEERRGRDKGGEKGDRRRRY